MTTIATARYVLLTAAEALTGYSVPAMKGACPEPSTTPDEWYYDDEEEGEHDPTCPYCHGGGGDPWCDGVLRCPRCDGEGYEWW